MKRWIRKALYSNQRARSALTVAQVGNKGLCSSDMGGNYMDYMDSPYFRRNLETLGIFEVSHRAANESFQVDYVDDC